jgi:uncharacterized protein involved in propanediol utilization
VRSSVVSARGPASGAASFIADVRRQTTAILKDMLDEERLRRLRAEGEAMDDVHVVAYVLDAIGRTARD